MCFTLSQKNKKKIMFYLCQKNRKLVGFTLPQKKPRKLLGFTLPKKNRKLLGFTLPKKTENLWVLLFPKKKKLLGFILTKDCNIGASCFFSVHSTSRSKRLINSELECFLKRSGLVFLLSYKKIENGKNHGKYVGIFHK